MTTSRSPKEVRLRRCRTVTALDHLKNLEADPFGSQEDFLDDADGLWDERSYLTTLLETSVLANDSDIEDDISQLSVQLVDDVSRARRPDIEQRRDIRLCKHDGSNVRVKTAFTYRVKDSGGALSEVGGGDDHGS